MKPSTDYFFVFGVLCLILLFIVRYLKRYNTSANAEVLDYNEMENIFFSNISVENKPYKLLNIYFPFDLMIIKSLLMSEGIPYYVEFEHRMSLQPCIQIINYNNANLYILEEDYDDAIELIENYVRTKILNEFKAKETLRNLFELLVLGWVMFSPKYNLGIEINYKEKIQKK